MNFSKCIKYKIKIIIFFSNTLLYYLSNKNENMQHYITKFIIKTAMYQKYISKVYETTIAIANNHKTSYDTTSK